MFDREKNDSFIFDVEARDGVASSLPGADGPNRGKFFTAPYVICR